MSFIDKILNAMKLNDDYDDDDDFLDDDMDDYEEERPKKSFFKKNQSDSFDDIDDDDFEEEPLARKSLKQPVKTLKTVNSSKPTTSNNYSAPKATTTSSKVSPIRTRKAANDMAVCVVKPRNMEDAREITETLLANCTVVLNMEGLDLDLAQRIIDFTSGSCYAINGNLQKISNYIFIITPASVDVSGDFQDLLNGAFDIPSMNFNY